MLSSLTQYHYHYHNIIIIIIFSYYCSTHACNVDPLRILPIQSIDTLAHHSEWSGKFINPRSIMTCLFIKQYVLVNNQSLLLLPFETLMLVLTNTASVFGFVVLLLRPNASFFLIGKNLVFPLLNCNIQKT